jgi:hypothetical protein
VTPPIVNPLDVAFVFAVTFAGLLFPPAALGVGAAFFALSWYLTDQRSEGPPP